MSPARNLDQVTHGRRQPSLGSEIEFYLEQLVEGYSEKKKKDLLHTYSKVGKDFT